VTIRPSKILALACLAASAPALAVTTPQYPVPYLGGAVSTLSPDSVRKSDDVGGGYQLWLGFPIQWLTDDREAIEVRLLDHQMRREVDKSDNFQTGLSADYVYDLGSTAQRVGFLSGTKLFALAGLTYVQEDNFGQKQNVFGASGGVGLLIPLGFKGWGVRLDGRVQAEKNGETCNEAAVNNNPPLCEAAASYLIDYMFSAGLQIPLTIFFDRPKPVPPAKDCPVSVVSPESGRSDECAADGDRDGVPDGSDHCPGTAAGQPVDERGCSR
jgi:OmpA-OmpF porin, OOP family